MDRISDSGSDGRGSNPLGGTRRKLAEQGQLLSIFKEGEVQEGDYSLAG